MHQGLSVTSNRFPNHHGNIVFLLLTSYRCYDAARLFPGLLNGSSLSRKQRLQKHLQKLASAAPISFAERALLQDPNRFLSKMNKEAKVRRATKSEILGKAKVMSYDDFREARAKRAAKEKAIAGKGKRGRKRKSPAPEPKTTVARISEVPEPWRAPVARIIAED